MLPISSSVAVHTDQSQQRRVPQVLHVLVRGGRLPQFCTLMKDSPCEPNVHTCSNLVVDLCGAVSGRLRPGQVDQLV